MNAKDLLFMTHQIMVIMEPGMALEVLKHQLVPVLHQVLLGVMVLLVNLALLLILTERMTI